MPRARGLNALRRAKSLIMDFRMCYGRVWLDMRVREGIRNGKWAEAQMVSCSLAMFERTTHPQQENSNATH